MAQPPVSRGLRAFLGVTLCPFSTRGLPRAAVFLCSLAEVFHDRGWAGYCPDQQSTRTSVQRIFWFLFWSCLCHCLSPLSLSTPSRTADAAAISRSVQVPCSAGPRKLALGFEEHWHPLYIVTAAKRQDLTCIFEATSTPTGSIEKELKRIRFKVGSQARVKVILS